MKYETKDSLIVTGTSIAAAGILTLNPGLIIAGTLTTAFGLLA